MKIRPRVAWLFPAAGLIDAELTRLGEQFGFDLLIVRVPVTSGYEHSVISMGDVESLIRAAVVAKETNPDVVAWACTSGSFMGDPAVLAAQIDSLEQTVGVPATTTTAAILRAIEKRALRTVSVITPYTEYLGMPFVTMLRSHQIDVLSYAHAGFDTDENISSLTIAELAPLARKVWRDGSDGWVIPCTALRTFGTLEWFERTYKRPVVMANLATLERVAELLDPHKWQWQFGAWKPTLATR